MTTVELRRVASVRVSNVNKHSVEGERLVRLCNYTDVYYNPTVHRDLPFMEATATPEQIATFGLRDGDTVITKDSETADDIGIATHIESPPADLVCGYHLAIIRPGPEVNAKYLTWSLRSRTARRSMSQLATGMTRVGLTYDAINRTPIRLPNLEYQRRIADFLDAQIARMDSVASLRARQMALLQESFDSSWAEATRALPGEQVQLRRVLISIVDGPFGSSLTSSHYSDEGTRVIRLGNIGIASFRDDDKAYVSGEYGRKLGYHAVHPGDLIMAGLGDERWPLGRCCVAPDDIGPTIVKADCYRIRLHSSVSAHYAAWYLSSHPSRQALLEMSRGATRARLNTALAREASIRVPSRAIQERYVTTLAVNRKELVARLGDLKQLLATLEEAKQSLITAAVSEEFDVTTASDRSVPAWA